MMEGMDNGWVMGHGYTWIIGIILLVVLIWVIVRVVNQRNRSK